MSSVLFAQKSVHEALQLQPIESIAQAHVEGILGNSLNANQATYRLVRRPNGKLKVVMKVPEEHDSQRVWVSNGIILSAGIVGFGVLLALPEDYTNWNKEEIKFSTVVRNWRSNISNGFVIDEDNLFLNYVMHPYFGAVYYMTLRGAGYNWWNSALYSFAMSTFFWECGIEAFAEKPSIQDIIVTPVVGSLLGELFFIAKKDIKNNDDKVLGSGFVGHTCMLLMDPLNEVQDWFKMGSIKRGIKKDYIASSAWQLGPQGLSLNLYIQF